MLLQEKFVGPPMGVEVPTDDPDYADGMGQNVDQKFVNQETVGGDIPICVIRHLWATPLWGQRAGADPCRRGRRQQNVTQSSNCDAATCPTLELSARIKILG